MYEEEEELWREWPQDPRILVSNMGYVVSCKRGEPYPLKAWRINGGYQVVAAVSGHATCVHRMVAETWIDNPNHYKEVNHINGDKTDNRVENLEWTTHSEIMRRAYRTGLTKGRRTPIRVPETGEVFESISECARRLGVPHGNISDCLAGRASTRRGYHFEYA